MNENFYLYLSTYTHSILFFIPKKLCIWKKKAEKQQKNTNENAFSMFLKFFFFIFKWKKMKNTLT